MDNKEGRFVLVGRTEFEALLSKVNTRKAKITRTSVAAGIVNCFWSPILRRGHLRSFINRDEVKPIVFAQIVNSGKDIFVSFQNLPPMRNEDTND